MHTFSPLCCLEDEEEYEFSDVSMSDSSVARRCVHLHVCIIYLFLCCCFEHTYKQDLWIMPSSNMSLHTFTPYDLWPPRNQSCCHCPPKFSSPLFLRPRVYEALRIAERLRDYRHLSRSSYLNMSSSRLIFFPPFHFAPSSGPGRITKYAR